MFLFLNLYISLLYDCRIIPRMELKKIFSQLPLLKSKHGHLTDSYFLMHEILIRKCLDSISPFTEITENWGNYRNLQSNWVNSKAPFVLSSFKLGNFGSIGGLCKTQFHLNIIYNRLSSRVAEKNISHLMFRSNYKKWIQIFFRKNIFLLFKSILL